MHGVEIAALQETNWFGNAEEKDGVVPAAGRPTPQVGHSRKRGEGATIALLGSAVTLWKADGEQGRDGAQGL